MSTQKETIFVHAFMLSIANQLASYKATKILVIAGVLKTESLLWTFCISKAMTVDGCAMTITMKINMTY